ncbi:hypothetical protein NAC44_19865 [Allorhizobium sp. BGMRC 0089]|uniref:hypothetical protein n=1 Tax=Allorhizobium sonneratiae TaxID=2934936 RepID=UPI002033B57A|nr:hypothetical protein [Allorhizobium sonneratiae]MCM2294590.1 hypothetical protein [Allorhizobium sonneratiae]
MKRPRHRQSGAHRLSASKADDLLAEIQDRLIVLDNRLKAATVGQAAATPLRAGRQLNGAAAILAFSVLADSAIEHYRGSFRNKAMYTPLAVTSLTLAASLSGVFDRRPERHVLRDTVYAGAGLTGLIGFCFHGWNVLKRTGGLSWHNLFYAAPIGAPMALLLAGGYGRAAEKVRDTEKDAPVQIAGFPGAKLLGAIASAGLMGTVAEAALLHFRGAFHNRVMFAPVTVPPLAALLLGACVIRPAHALRRLARSALKLTAALGFVGSGFHIYGIARNMGGWRNWRQNLLVGPPLPAPPSFTGIAMTGLAALSLMEGKDG